MLKDAHVGLEVINATTSRIEAEEWGEAERALTHVQEIVGRLLKEVGDKARETMLVPAPDQADRG